MTIYVNDLNIIRTSNGIEDVVAILSYQFKRKDPGLTTFCLGLQIEHLPHGILPRQSSYIRKILKQFSMDQAHSIRTPMIVRSLDPSCDPFWTRSSNELAFGPHYPYMVVVGALMCLANCIRVYILFVVICWLYIVVILPGNTILELSRFSNSYEALKVWVFSLPTILRMVN